MGLNALNVKKQNSGKKKFKKSSPNVVQYSTSHNISEEKNSTICTQKEQIQEVNIELFNNQSKEKVVKYCKDMGFEPTVKDNKKCKFLLWLKKYNILITLLFSLMLVVIGSIQCMTYNRQADIASDANKLAQYQYRFEFYEKLEDLQKEVSVIKKEPQLDIDQLSKLSYEILSLARKSSLLFDKGVSNDINKILNRHLEFLTKLNNGEINYADYENEMKNLVLDYGNFLNSDDFKEYLDINEIE